ncbi:MAG: histidinol dehydrogenase [Endomicrobiales bacterium]
MNPQQISEQVREVIRRVGKEGDKALVYYAARFDRVKLTPGTLRVRKDSMRRASAKIEPLLARSLRQAAANITRFHKDELRRLTRYWSAAYGKARVGQKLIAVESAGLYIPGGRFPYPSTVLMTAIPARIAGVKKLVMVSPPGKLTDAVLFAAQLAGVDEIFQVGGPAAVAALALSTKTVPRVDIIVGPGNAYVNEAKRQVFGTVGIDALAGPSDVAIVADDTTPPEFVVADMLAQAEHDPLARATLVTDSLKLISKIRAALPAGALGQARFIRCGRREMAQKVNTLAPEHVEVMVKDPERIVKGITSAGTIFVGAKTPTAVGDYWAGPSHVLPTNGTARFSGGLSVSTFLKKINIIDYRRVEMTAIAPCIEKIAEAEGFEHHRRSVRMRAGR